MKRKTSTATALSIMSWLVDMCAPDPGDTLHTRHGRDEKIAWLMRTAPRPWLAVDAGSVREPWMLADTGLIEMRHLGPSVLRISKAKMGVTCFPAVRLSDLGARWCKLILGAVDDTEETNGLFDAMIEQAMKRPGDLAKIKAELVDHGARADAYLSVMGRHGFAGDLDWVALCLLGRGVLPTDLRGHANYRVDEFVELLRGVPL